MSALSGLDIALWDLKGKRLGVPVWSLLGGLCRDKVKVSARHYPPRGRWPTGTKQCLSHPGVLLDRRRQAWRRLGASQDPERKGIHRCQGTPRVLTPSLLPRQS